MAIKMIMAVDKHWGIGYRNKLPWNIKEDLAFFKKITDGSCVIMGRKTFESMGSEPLKNRRNVIVTSKDMSKLKESKSLENKCNVFVTSKDFSKSKESNLHFAKYEDVKFKLETVNPKNLDIFIIGGKSLYEGLIDFADEIIVTNINGDYETDVKINPKILKGFKINKKEYLSDKANVTYYKRTQVREYTKLWNNTIALCNGGLFRINTTYCPFIEHKKPKKSKTKKLNNSKEENKS